MSDNIASGAIFGACIGAWIVLLRLGWSIKDDVRAILKDIEDIKRMMEGKKP